MYYLNQIRIRIDRHSFSKLDPYPDPNPHELKKLDPHKVNADLKH
jgi:hypothetical protein